MAKSDLVTYILDDCLDVWKQQRKNLIEGKWQENLDAFNCDSNGKKWKKSEDEEEWMSKTFVPITKIKILGFWSIIIDLLLMNNRIPFDLKPSPLDQLNLNKQDKAYDDAIQAQIEAGKMLIDQQFLDCQADRVLMKLVMSDAMYGECISKFYVKEVVRKGYVQKSYAPQGLPDPEGKYTRFEKVEEVHNSPAVEYWSVWDVWRDLETDNLQDGVGIICYQPRSAYHMRKKIGQPYYIDQSILDVISGKSAIQAGVVPQGTSTSNTSSEPPGRRQIKKRRNNIEVFEFWGRAPRVAVEKFEKEAGLREDVTESENGIDDGDEIEILCEIANNEIIRFCRNEEGHRPWYRSVWEEKLDYSYASGVADNVADMQLVINGMTRAYENNKKLSGNVMGIGNSEKTPNWDKKFKPGLYIEADETVEDVRTAWQQIIITDVGESLMNGMGMFERYADDSSMLPKIVQGATLDKRKPDTFSEMNMLQQNAGKYTGGVIKNLDEGTIENWCNDFFSYNMDDPANQQGKGNFIAQALGYSSYQDRIVRVNKILQALQLVGGNPEFSKECQLDKMLFEAFKALDIDTGSFIKTEEQKQAEFQQMMNSPEMKAKMEMLFHQVQQAAANVEKTKADTNLKQVEAGTKRDATDIKGYEVATKGARGAGGKGNAV
jgi:hypothetical protein